MNLYAAFMEYMEYCMTTEEVAEYISHYGDAQ